MFSVLLNPILPVFAILFVGFLAGRLNWTIVDEARVLNRFAMTVLLPIFIFRAVALAPVENFAFGALALFALTEAVFYAAGFFVARKLFNRTRQESLLLGFCCVFANNAYYVLPIAKILYGIDGALPITSVIILDATLAFGCTMVALEAMAGRDTGAGLWLVLGRIAKLPLIWALALGGIFAVAEWPWPLPLDTFTDFVGSAASPIALFAMGVILSKTRLMPQPVSTFGIVMKTAVFPLALAGVYMIAPSVGEDAPLFILAGAGPTGAMAFSLALLYGVRTDAIMQITVWTSALTLGTLAALA